MQAPDGVVGIVARRQAEIGDPLANPDRVLSKDTILDRVWQYDFEGESGIVESYVSYLRRKIDTTEPRLLHTVRGFGYVLRTPGN